MSRYKNQLINWEVEEGGIERDLERSEGEQGKLWKLLVKAWSKLGRGKSHVTRTG